MRNTKIDNLRFIGTILIILAHLNIPDYLMIFRSFDVILLVMISGFTYANNKRRSYLAYVWYRIKKILIPTYILVFLIFTSYFFSEIFLKLPFPFSFKFIVNTILLQDGLGYIWISKVYILISLISPVLDYISSNIKSNLLFLLTLCLFFLFYLVCTHFFVNNLIFDFYISYLVSYSIVFMIGTRYKYNNQFKDYFLVFCITSFTILFYFYMIKGLKFDPNIDKYPPGLTYLVYGFFISSILFKIVPTSSNWFIFWVSKNSFKIYIIHVYLLFIYNFIEKKIIFFKDNMYMEIIFIYLFSFSLTAVINRIFRIYNSRRLT